MAKRPALGKGLGAMLADAGTLKQSPEIRISEGGPASVNEIPVGQITANPFQPRTEFDEEALQELTDSIKTLGIIQPLTLRQTAPKQYQIISGERRYRAAVAAGLKTVPAYVRKADDIAMLEMAIVENIQREDLGAIETALSFQRLMDECSLTQEDMADRVGKKRATVANYLRLLKLPEEIQKAIKVGKISAGHAKALLGIDSTEQQLALCENAIKYDWSVRTLEQKVQMLAQAPEAPAQDTETEEIPECFNILAQKIGNHFNGKVKVKRNADGHGTITIRFDNESQVKSFIKALKK